MKRWIERGVFLLAAAAMVIAAAAIPTRRVQEDTLPEVYVYRGYAAAADAAWDEKSLDFAVKRFSHLLEAYFPGSEHVYMSVIPDKAAFMETPEGYTPAGAQETADYLAQRLPVEIIDIAPLLALEDYYRTDPHWRQERLSAVAQTISEAMGAPVPETPTVSWSTARSKTGRSATPSRYPCAFSPARIPRRSARTELWKRIRTLRTPARFQPQIRRIRS